MRSLVVVSQQPNDHETNLQALVMFAALLPRRVPARDDFLVDVYCAGRAELGAEGGVSLLPSQGGCCASLLMMFSMPQAILSTEEGGAFAGPK